MGNNELCRICTLSALCLPAGGPKKLAEDMWVCEYCQRALIKAGNTFVEVEPNIACWWLVVRVLTRDDKVCPDCLEGKKTEEAREMKRAIEMIKQYEKSKFSAD